MPHKDILIIVPNLNSGGAERVSVNIANYLASQNCNVSLVTVQQANCYSDQIDCKVNLYSLNCRRVLLSLFKVKNLIKETRPDIVISTTHRMNVIISVINKFTMYPTKYYLRLPSSPRKEIEYNVFGFWLKYIITFAYKNADYVIAQTNEMKDEAIKYFKVKERKIIVIVNPIDTFYIDRKLHACKNPYKGNSINYLAVGRLSYAKGFDVLIDAFNIVAKNIDDAYLYIVGRDDGERDKLQKKVEIYGLENKVIFTGYIKDPYEYYKYADVVVLSSRWEGLPNTVLESLYLGVPVIATKCISMMSELINDGINGYLVDIEDINQLSKAMIKYNELTRVESRKIVAGNRMLLELVK